MIALMLCGFSLAGLLTAEDAQAALQVKQGTFAKRTTAGTTLITGVGFQPKALIFYWTKQTTSNGTQAANISSGQGFAANNGTAITMAANVVTSLDAVATTDTNSFHSSTVAIASMVTTANPITTESEATITSMDVDGFTVNWTKAAGTADIIHYVAIGGTDLTNANVGTTSMFTAIGNSAVTGVGFQPDAVLLLANNRTTVLNAVPAASGSPAINRGFMVGGATPSQGSIGWGARDAQTAVIHGSVFSATRFNILRRNLIDVAATCVSMDTDGFTMNASATGGATSVSWLALKGGQYKVGNITQPIAGTPPFTTGYTGVGFIPTGLILTSGNSIAADNIVSTLGTAGGATFSVGAASASTARGSIWGGMTAATVDANMNNDATKVIRLAYNSSATAVTTAAVADLSTFDADGFTLNWTTRADAVARRMLYFAMGSALVTTSTTVGDTTEPTSLTLAPGAGANNLDAFTLVSTGGDDTVTGATVTLLPANAFNNVGLVEITNAGGTALGSVANPSSNTVAITLTTNIISTATPTTYYVRITPKTHAAMPAVPGASYAVTGTVTAMTSSFTKTYNDLTSATLTLDNASPAAPTLFTGTAGNNQVALSWTNPGADFSQVVILRKTATIADIPVEGATYVANNTIGTSTVIYAGPLAAYTDLTAVNGTGYYYKIFAKDAYGNYSSTGMSAGPYTPVGPTTTVGNGTAPPTPVYLAPGGLITDLDYFTLVTSTGTDVVTGLTLTLSGGGAPNAYSAIGLITITSNDGLTTYGTLANPVSDTPTVSLTTNITASTTSTQYRVRITPKSHILMPAPASGALYTVAGTVTGLTSPNTKSYGDSSSASIEIDNASTDVATWGVITPGNTQIDLSWANPLDPDLDPVNSVVVLRKVGSAVTEVPVEGVTYGIGNTVGGATVRYAGAVEGFIDTGLTNFTNYYYAIFAKDSNGNYSIGSTTGPHQPWIPVCVPGIPTLTITPGARNAIPTDVAKYTVSIKNNDNALCTATDFTLSFLDSNNVDFVTPSVLSATILNIAPGGTKQSNLTVTVQGTAELGNSNITTINVSAPAHTAPAAVTATTTAANPLMHNSKTTGSTKWGTAGWGITGGKYGTFNCYICHEESVFGADGTANVKKIRPTITMPADASGADNWPSGGKTTPTITFDDTRAGSSSYADSNAAHATSTRVCEVCHTYQGGVEPNNSGVRNHAYNMSGATPQEQAHNSLGDCLSCHPHNGGFKAQGCTACHGNPLLIPSNLSINPATGSASVGAHPIHQSESFSCDYCHGVGSSGSGGGALHNQGAIYMEFTGFGQLEASDGTYKGALLGDRPFGYLGNDLGVVDGSLSCATVYCHGGTMYPALAAPTWTGTAACGSCHNDTTADASWLGSHADHLSATGANLDCSVCHGAGYSAGTLKPAGHLNGKVKIDLGAYGSYSKVANGGEVTTLGLPTAVAYGNCTVSCHGAAATPAWGTDFGAVPAKCTKCHNDGTAGALLINAVPVASKDAHVVHVNANSTYVTNDCEACHGTNAQNGTHANHYTDGIYPNGIATYGTKLTAYSTANKNCTNSCHVATTTNLWIATPPALACTDCHSSTYIGGNNVATGFNATPATGLHAMSATGVQKHDGTITGGCAACHVTEDTANHINASFSPDALANGDRWVTRSNMTYTQMTPTVGRSGTCSGTGLAGCHSDAGKWSRLWSTEANVADTMFTVGNAKCNVCHGQWSSLSGSAGWATGSTHAAASTRGSGHEPATPNCDACHVFATGSARHDTATHQIDMNSNGSSYVRNGAIYGTSRAGCTACHAGAGSVYDFPISYFVGNLVSGTAIPMPACDSCHNNAGKVATVPQVIIGTTANSSSSHVDADGGGAAKTINVVGATAKCEDCHAGHADNTSGANDVEILTNSTVLGTTVPTMNWSYSTHFNKIKLGGTSTSGSTEAEMCWNCHNTVSVSEWGINSHAKTGSITYDYGTLYSDLSTIPGTTTSNWTTGFWRSAKGIASGSTTNPFWYKRGAIQSTHSVNFDSGVVTITTGNTLGFGRTETKDAVGNIRCSLCHDVHGTHNAGTQNGLANDVSGGTGTADAPYLRGTWTGNQYAEDGAPQFGMHANWTIQGTATTSTTFYGRVPRASANPANSGLPGTSPAKAGAWWIDQNSANPTGITTTSTEVQRLAVADATSGLCEQCHGTNKTGTWTTTAIGNLNWSTNGVGEANNWISSYNGHGNSVVGGPGRGAAASAEARGRNILTRVARGTAAIIQGEVSKGAVDMGVVTETGTRGYSYRSSTGSGTGYLWFPRTSSATTNSGSGASTAYRTFAWGTAPGITPSTRGYTNATGTVPLTFTTALTEATHDAQANYHTFTCAKCHNPHASRLPKLMITNCLDTNHNTWEDYNYTGATLPTIWANTRHSQWASAQNCHRLDARAALTTGQTVNLGRGWNRVTPWMEYTNPNSTRATNPNP